MKTDIQNKNITQSEKELFELFINTHKKYIINYKEINIEYYYSGKGGNTILILPHISSLFNQEMAFHLIIDLENNNKVLAPELCNVNNIDEIADIMNYILEKENITNVIIYGQSGSGITAQVFFNRYYNKVKGMILVNTIAPRNNTKNNSRLLKMIKLFPSFLLKYIVIDSIFFIPSIFISFQSLFEPMAHNVLRVYEVAKGNLAKHRKHAVI
ncbi:unnamed protein product [marine sediment metagenome]|uniref:AB hydrolase-1 domain-containing protein n=1 Tax=marine sediment metagenome TaxID=412755 RepID=X0YSE4_9ZZZZ